MTNIIVPLLPFPPAPPIIIEPETVNAGLPEAANVRVPALPEVVFLPNMILEQAALVVFTVTANPLSIKTASPAAGTELPADPPDVPDQVDVAFQFPFATE